MQAIMEKYEALPYEMQQQVQELINALSLKTHRTNDRERVEHIMSLCGSISNEDAKAMMSAIDS